MKQTIVKKKEDDMNCLNLPLPIHHNVPLQIFHRDSEVVGGLVIHNVPEHKWHWIIWSFWKPPDNGAELDIFLDVFLIPTTFQVVKEHLPGKKEKAWNRYIWNKT